MTSHAPTALPRTRRTRLTFWSWETLAGWLIISPWLLGFLLFTLGPMIASIGISLTQWDLLTPARWIGLGNFVKMATDDPNVALSLRVTTVYALVSVPLSLALGLFLAVLLNEKIRFQSFARTVFYLPSVVSGVAVALLWRWIFATDVGLINSFLAMVGISGPAWLSDSRTALPALIIMSLWAAGGGMVIYLVGLQSVPTELYEAAEMDGANGLHRFWNITLPMISPVIFFQAVMGIIGALQTFTQAFIMTEGGPKNATLFFLLYLYRNAFQYFDMGYASALAWVLFAYIMLLTLLLLRSASSWVYYEGSSRR
jgi:multiple sugar transport system permease protein